MRIARRPASQPTPAAQATVRRPLLVPAIIAMLVSAVLPARAAGPAGATTTTAPAGAAATVPDPLAGVRTFSLDNGLTVALRPDATHPVVAVQMYYRAGARHETIGITGIAHYLEHMLFRGTEGFGLADVTGVIERAGGEWHGYTWLDGTTYFEAAPRHLLPTLLHLEAERMTKARMAPDEVEPERGAIFQEYRGYQLDPRSDLFDAVMALLFQQHPYRNNTMGWESDLAGITHADLVSFYRRWYGPRNAVLAIAGDFDPAEAESLVRRAFEAIPAGGDDTSTRTVEPPLQGPRRLSIVRDGASPALLVSFHAPAATQPRTYAALLVLDTVLATARGLSFYHHSGDQTGGGAVDPFARLAALTRGGPAAEIGTAFVPTVYPGHYSIYATPLDGRSLTELEAAIFAALAEASRTISDTEVAAARRAIAAADLAETDSPVEIAHEMAYWTALGGPEARRRVIESLAAVTTDEVRALAAGLAPSRAAVGLLLPPAAGRDIAAAEGAAGDDRDEEAHGPMARPACGPPPAAAGRGVESARPPHRASRASVSTRRLLRGDPGSGGIGTATAIVDARPALPTFVLRLAIAAPSTGAGGVAGAEADAFVARLRAAAAALSADERARASAAACGVRIEVVPPGDGRFDERDSLHVEATGPAGAWVAAMMSLESAIGRALSAVPDNADATPGTPGGMALHLLDTAVREARQRSSAAGAGARLAIALVAPFESRAARPALEALARRIDATLRRKPARTVSGAPAGSGPPFVPGRREAAMPGIPQGRLLLAVPGDADAAAQEAVAWLLHHNYSGRLGVRAIAETGLVYDMDSESARRGAPLVHFTMGADPAQIARLETDLQEVLDGAADGFSEAEVAAYRSHAAGRAAVRLAHPDQAARLWTTTLLRGGDDGTPGRDAAAAANLDPGAVNAAAARMLVRERRLSIVVDRSDTTASR